MIEAATDLRIWNQVAKLGGNETSEYLDSEASKFGYRFYRARVGMIASNIIGYVSITLPPGFSMIANPLDSPNNRVGHLLKGWPDGTTLHKFDTCLFRLAENCVSAGNWTDQAETLMPGEGALFFNPTTDYKSLSFVGEVMQGYLSIPIPSGFSVRSSLVPQPGSLEDLGFPIANGDVLQLFDCDRQKYIVHTYEDSMWKPRPPILGVGESFWIAKAKSGNWTRNFVVAPPEGWNDALAERHALGQSTIGQATSD